MFVENITALIIGLGIGLLATVPLYWVWTRRTAARVQTLEREVRANERLAVLGTMTGGLAHEIKNPLSTVGLNIQLLKEDFDELVKRMDPQAFDSGRIQRRLDALQRETTRLREILEDFLRFAGRIELDRQPLDLNQIAQEVTDFFAPQAHEANVQLRCQFLDRPLLVSGDQGLLKQALLNLLINAIQAMQIAQQRKDVPHGGANELLVRTAEGGTRQKPLAQLEIVDTGPGIAPEHLPRIFQPYFTTKKAGTGLGLPTTRRIVEEHGGHVNVHSDVGRGSSFTMEFPAIEAGAVAPEDGASNTAAGVNASHARHP